VGKGFSGVETPLFENMLAVRAIDAEEEVQVPAQDDVVQEHVIKEITTEQVLDKCSALVLRVKGLENANAAQQLEIIKLKARVKKLERLNKVKSSKLRRLKKEDTKVQEAVEVVTTTKLITKVVTAVATQKKDQIEMDAEYAKKLQEELEKEHEEAYMQIDWNAAFDHVQAKET
nr:hypothetical protein [Tanacetum cinerariifolium]